MFGCQISWSWGSVRNSIGMTILYTKFVHYIPEGQWKVIAYISDPSTGRRCWRVKVQRISTSFGNGELWGKRLVFWGRCQTGFLSPLSVWQRVSRMWKRIQSVSPERSAGGGRCSPMIFWNNLRKFHLIIGTNERTDAKDELFFAPLISLSTRAMIWIIFWKLMKSQSERYSQRVIRGWHAEYATVKRIGEEHGDEEKIRIIITVSRRDPIEFCVDNSYLICKWSTTPFIIY